MNTWAIESFLDRKDLAFVEAAKSYALERSEDGWIAGQFYNCRLSSAFQPIVDPVNSKTIGHAAYIRSVSGNEIALSPWNIFALASKDKQLVNLDNLCRIIHALNYFDKASEQNRLFVGMHARLLESGQKGMSHGIFEKFLDLMDVRTDRLVIEIPSVINCNYKLLRRAIINYRSRGYLIAANYSAACDDWMLELTGLYPDIIRIAVRDLLRRNVKGLLVDAVHRLGAMLLVRDIETSDQAEAATRAGADYLQGNYLGRTLRVLETINSSQSFGKSYNNSRSCPTAV